MGLFTSAQPSLLPTQVRVNFRRTCVHREVQYEAGKSGVVLKSDVAELLRLEYIQMEDSLAEFVKAPEPASQEETK